MDDKSNEILRELVDGLRPLQPGDRVVFLEGDENYPTCSVEAGTTAVVDRIDRDGAWVRVDRSCNLRGYDPGQWRGERWPERGFYVAAYADSPIRSRVRRVLE